MNTPTPMNNDKPFPIKTVVCIAIKSDGITFVHKIRFPEGLDQAFRDRLADHVRDDVSLQLRNARKTGSKPKAP